MIAILNGNFIYIIIYLYHINILNLRQPCSIPIISIFDSSPLYTSGKNNNFYQNYSGLYSRCSYNKIIFPEENNSGYKITNNFDGYGG